MNQFRKADILPFSFLSRMISTYYKKFKMIKPAIYVFFIFFLNLCCVQNYSQTYSLSEVIYHAQNNSPQAMKVQTSKENKYWQWKTYKSEFKPQLLLQSVLPAYQNKNIAVIQDDGSVVFRNVNQNSAAALLSLEQNIGFTGGKLFLSSDISRLDDFNKKIESYSGSPFFIGIEQPLFAFNTLKWTKLIEPVKYEESLKEFVAEKERIAYHTAIRYFQLLISQINYQIAFVNRTNADTIYKIGDEKFALGKISKNELLQLRYGFITAKKSMSNAKLSIKKANLELGAYIGLDFNQNVTLLLPDSITSITINDTLAMSKAFENSQQSVQFKRRILEARRDSEKARRESGLQANLSMSYGQTNAANTIHGIYKNAGPMQTINIGLSIPLLDWGRTKASRKTAEANLALVNHTVNQDQINFRQKIITEIETFRMLQDFIVYTAEADKTASKRYEIAKLRYIYGDISITEYNIAQEQKDRGKQDYILALRDYWLTYYYIRILTLYDFKNNISLTN